MPRPHAGLCRWRSARIPTWRVLRFPNWRSTVTEWCVGSRAARVTRENRTDAFLRLSRGSTVHGEVCWQYGKSVGEMSEAPMSMREVPLEDTTHLHQHLNYCGFNFRQVEDSAARAELQPSERLHPKLPRRASGEEFSSPARSTSLVRIADPGGPFHQSECGCDLSLAIGQ